MALFSTVTGELTDTAGMDADYWYQSIRRTVQFEKAVRNARDAGYRVFIESSPHPVLIAGIEETLADGNPAAEAFAIPSLGRDDGGLDRFWLSVGQAHVAGVAVDWRAAFEGGRQVPLPTYAFQRRRFWLPPFEISGGDLGGLGLMGAEHGLLGAVVERPDSGGVVLTGRLSVVAQPWLTDHAVAGIVLFPGAGFVELALRAGDQVDCAVVEELTLSSPLLLSAADRVQVQVVVGRRRWCRPTGRIGVFPCGISPIRNGSACRGRAERGLARAGRRFVGVAAGRGDGGGCDRRLRTTGRAGL